MQVSAEYLEGVQFSIKARGHEVRCDQPPDNGGADTGITPPEFLLGALASCGAFYAAQYLRTRRLPVEGLVVTVDAEKASAPARLSRFDIRVQLPTQLDARHEDGLLRAVRSCLIHNTLQHPPAIHIAIGDEGELAGVASRGANEAAG